MKKRTRNGKALTLLLGLFLSSLMFSCETINKSKTEDMFSRETKVFYWYADSLNINIPNEKHTFFLIPDNSCSGCVVKTIDVLFPETDSSTLITTPYIAQNYIVQIDDNVIIDSVSLINKLNWEHRNIIEIKTKENKVVFAKSYSSDELVGF